MAAEIYIVSGFLGAGKTTLIQKLLKEAFSKSNVALIENDFGEISVDAALMRTANIKVTELSSGCICCSISGNFAKSVMELLKKFHPDKLIIEPSGVGKLSDIYKKCTVPEIRALAEVKAKITVADVKRCKTYLNNFGEFFQDQIENADIILLSRTGEFPNKTEEALKLIRGLNSHAPVLSEAWDEINAYEILNLPNMQHEEETHSENREHLHEHCCGHEHGHDHSAGEVFDTVTIRTEHTFTRDELASRIEEMERSFGRKILRMKGILHGTDGYLNLQYVPGDIRITDCDTAGDMLCVIGSGLNQRELISVFNREH